MSQPKPKPEPFPYPYPYPYPGLNCKMENSERCPYCQRWVEGRICNCRLPAPSFDISFECWMADKFKFDKPISNFIIFNSEDPNRISKTVDKINECFREIRGFYWDLMENAKIPMSFVNSETRHNVDAPLKDEDKEFLPQLLHINETIHQLLAPHFICEDIQKENYDHYMKNYEEFVKYIEERRNAKELPTLNLGFFWDQMMNLFEAVEKCFEQYCKRKAEH